MSSPLEEISTSWSKEAQIILKIKRDDLLHPLVSGNKFRKLKYNLIEAKDQGFDTVLSFGGAYSKVQSGYRQGLWRQCSFALSEY